MKRKFGETEKNPRYLEAEGLYVGQKPYMTNANKNLLADRLLKQPDQVWFYCLRIFKNFHKLNKLKLDGHKMV